MLHKLLKYLGIFSFLVIVNFVLFYVSMQHNKRTFYVQNVLYEIDHPSNPLNQFQLSSAPLVLGTYTTELGTTDGRSANLKAFFRRYNSPLYDYADLIVSQADLYGFDYRLVPAIAMQESTLCKFIPDDSYNCWGWGIYGSTITRFSSYDEAIMTVSKGIKTSYIDHGLTTASQIMAKYTPSSPGSWAKGVNTVLHWLEE